MWLEDQEGEAEATLDLRMGTVGMLLSGRMYTVIYSCCSSLAC